MEKTKDRLPRKIKKGCRTLNGNPRTEWQRKARLCILRQVILQIKDEGLREIDEEFIINWFDYYFETCKGDVKRTAWFIEEEFWNVYDCW